MKLNCKSKKSGKWGLLVINDLTDNKNEIEQLARILNEQKGFPSENLIILRADTATRNGIIAAISNLIKLVNANDTVVIHFGNEEIVHTDIKINSLLNKLNDRLSKKGRFIW